jgi:hypothetical protein
MNCNGMPLAEHAPTRPNPTSARRGGAHGCASRWARPKFATFHWSGNIE